MSLAGVLDNVSLPEASERKSGKVRLHGIKFGEL